VLTCYKDYSKPEYIFLAPSENGLAWLLQGQNKMALGAIGIELGQPLEKFLTAPGKPGKWMAVGWDTRMRVKPDEALFFRVQGVTQMDDWETTTTHLLV
jgi:hypothetical protein